MLRLVLPLFNYLLFSYFFYAEQNNVVTFVNSLTGNISIAIYLTSHN